MLTAFALMTLVCFSKPSFGYFVEEYCNDPLPVPVSCRPEANTARYANLYSYSATEKRCIRTHFTFFCSYAASKNRFSTLQQCERYCTAESNGINNLASSAMKFPSANPRCNEPTFSFDGFSPMCARVCLKFHYKIRNFVVKKKTFNSI